ncbi:hypothetical protein NliqN6_5769 [Naganishia liquefaciens]|uniref:Uncharacterized protein n=1 Tax=Naganishia liquefaciens TaxID=104408 RepID=A0A8H3YIN6_9TREE|nr:hypothetical protein NliqN6_5769 [Naganishia liquefaciens]
MIVTSRPAFRSASVSSDATCASYESMTTASSDSGSSKYGIKLKSPLSPATPPQIEHHLKGRHSAQPSIVETDREGDNDAATVRSSSMRTYREGDERGMTGFAPMTTIEKPMGAQGEASAGLVPGPMRFSLRDEGAVPRESMETRVEIQINGEASSSVPHPPVSRYQEMLDAPVTPEQVAIWLYGTADRAVRPRPPHVESRQSSASTSRFSRPFLKIATALSASGSSKSPVSGPNSAASAPSGRPFVLGHALPAGTSIKTARSRSTNAESYHSPTGSSGWRRSFLGSRPASKPKRPKSMQIPADVRIGKSGIKQYDEEEKRWLPATRETARRFSMSGESDDNNLSDVAPSFGSSTRRPSSMLNRVSSAHQSFTSAASSVFLPTPAEEKEAFDFTSGVAPSSSTAMDVHPRSSSISKEGSSNGRFVKLLRRISGHAWGEDQSRARVAARGKQRPLSTADMTRFPASCGSAGSLYSTASRPRSISTAKSDQGELLPPVMPACKPHSSSRSLTDVRTLNSVDEEEPIGDKTPMDSLERPAIQERSSSLQTVV